MLSAFLHRVWRLPVKGILPMRRMPVYAVIIPALIRQEYEDHVSGAV
ncbi:MAG TPA: hypothetical protein PLG55_07155 [Methanospirillum sp.]|nr:hypothetical protein [Methanospirillum sp.]HPY60483.1 hypothetical protein [Methanospirillum sp.]HQB99064.1 hypothetical protein [Methanospirillum sp.]